MGLAQRFTHAVQWNVAISVTTIVWQLGIAAILARLLSPADFGLYAIAGIAFSFAATFGDRGLISAIAREPTLDRETVGAAIMVSCFLALGLAAITILAAPLAGIGTAADEKPIIIGLVQLTSLAVLFSALGAPAQAIMQREYRFRELGLIQFSGIAIGAGALSVAFALANYGPWSLVYGNIANMMISTLACWWKVRGHWSIKCQRKHMGQIVLVSLKMSVLRALDVLWGQLPLLIGHVRLTSTDVGIYQRSQAIVNIGIQATTGRVNSVLFPVIASRQNKNELLRDLVPPLIGLYALFLFAVTAFVAIMAPDIIAFLLGPNWSSANGPLVVNMLAFSILIASQPASTLLEASAQFWPRIVGTCFGVGVLLILGLLLVGRYGLIGIAWAAAASSVLMSMINIIAVIWRLQITIRAILSWLFPSIVVAGLLYFVLAACQPYFVSHTGSHLARILAAGIISVVVWAVGFRLVIGENKTKVLSDYLAPNTSFLAILASKILGIPVSKGNQL